jgi:hypothetical protein
MKMYTYQVEHGVLSKPRTLWQLIQVVAISEKELDLVTDLLPTDSVIFSDNCIITRVDTPVDHAE